LLHASETAPYRIQIPGVNGVELLQAVEKGSVNYKRGNMKAESATGLRTDQPPAETEFFAFIVSAFSLYFAPRI
jgi:hypothetical protein